MTNSHALKLNYYNAIFSSKWFSSHHALLPVVMAFHKTNLYSVRYVLPTLFSLQFSAVAQASLLPIFPTTVQAAPHFPDYFNSFDLCQAFLCKMLYRRRDIIYLRFCLLCHLPGLNYSCQCRIPPLVILCYSNVCNSFTKYLSFLIS